MLTAMGAVTAVVMIKRSCRGSHGSCSSHRCGSSARVMVAAGTGGGCGGSGWRRWQRRWRLRLAAGNDATKGGVRVPGGGAGDCGRHGGRGCVSNHCCGSSDRDMTREGVGRRKWERASERRGGGVGSGRGRRRGGGGFYLCWGFYSVLIWVLVGVLFLVLFGVGVGSWCW